MKMYLRDSEVAAYLGITRPTVWTWVKVDPSFPRPVRLSAGCTRFRLDELEAWAKARAEPSSAPS
jgi:prophage regulatory protein